MHLVGVLFGIAGAAALIAASIGRLPIGEVTGLLVYGAGLIGMFTASASYNLATVPKRKDWLRRIDHSVIFIMIAGSYTPFALRIGGETGVALLVAVWGVAALGVLAKLAFPRRVEKLSVAFYLAQGWCILFATGPLVEAVPSESISLLIIGGCVYSAGVIFHLLTMLPFHNVIWHLFVLAGAAIQYASIYSAIIR